MLTVDLYDMLYGAGGREWVLKSLAEEGPDDDNNNDAVDGGSRWY
jgi:hypothetical protein